MDKSELPSDKDPGHLDFHNDWEFFDEKGERIK